MLKSLRTIARATIVPAFCWAAFIGAAHAAGVVPDTSVILINEQSGEAVANVRNTDPYPVILHTSAVNTPEDKEALFVVNPPTARVEPGQTQLVRFMLINDAPLRSERLKRVVFEGLPPSSTDKNAVQLTVRQDLPVLVHPRGLPVEHEPWKHLKWGTEGDELWISNPSRYVVRLDQRIEAMPAKTEMVLPKNYILPGERLALRAGDGHSLAGISAIRLFPMSSYGYAVGAYDAPLSMGSANRAQAPH